MNEPVYRFRTSLSGFHKGDVTAYIEMTASQYRSNLLECEKTIIALQEENRSLQQQLNLLMMATPVTPAAPAVEEAPASAPAPAPAPVSPVPEEDIVSLELQAYRRAEAVERNANTRARKLYKQLEGVCVDTMDEFRTTDTAVKEAIEVMMQQAAALEQTYQTLSAALDASREKLAVMNELLCVENEDE